MILTNNPVQVARQIRDRKRLIGWAVKLHAFKQFTDHFRRNPEVSTDGAGCVGFLPWSAFASWREATFQSRMQMQIQE